MSSPLVKERLQPSGIRKREIESSWQKEQTIFKFEIALTIMIVFVDHRFSIDINNTFKMSFLRVLTRLEM